MFRHGLGQHLFEGVVIFVFLKQGQPCHGPMALPGTVWDRAQGTLSTVKRSSGAISQNPKSQITNGKIEIGMKTAAGRKSVARGALAMVRGRRTRRSAVSQAAVRDAEWPSGCDWIIPRSKVRSTSLGTRNRGTGNRDMRESCRNLAALKKRRAESYGGRARMAASWHCQSFSSTGQWSPTLHLA
jgi:hypothetical protein